MPSFCRHGRLEANCPICSKKQKGGYAPIRPARRIAEPRQPAAAPAQRQRRGGAPRAGALHVRRLARAADDGYRHDLVPGVHATADARLLADELAFSVARLDELAVRPPGLYAEVAAAGAGGDAAEREEALWLAFLIAYLSPLEEADPWPGIAAARVAWATGELPALAGVPTGPRSAHDPARGERTVAAYRAWAARAGSQAAAFAGEPSWEPERRFDRAFERLALPGFGRAQRYELLTVLGHLGVLAVRPTSLQLTVEPLDRTVVAAKRAFGIGDAMELRHRVVRLASELDVPVEALDLALLNFNRAPNAPRITAGASAHADPERLALLRDALGVGEPDDLLA
ncbi:MAG TPA: hypothetical protein VLA98_01750 [Solirubrobacteraceae bacterium]|nr:hypothetical protein [Solirubrobacteraceae bacterium]